MQFVHANFESSYFEKCIFYNCQFINCKLFEIAVTETTFNEYTFSKSGFGNSVFESYHFLKPILASVNLGLLGSVVLIDSKFSNSNKSIKFEGEIYFNDILDQINKFCID